MPEDITDKLRKRLPEGVSLVSAETYEDVGGRYVRVTGAAHGKGWTHNARIDDFEDERTMLDSIVAAVPNEPRVEANQGAEPEKQIDPAHAAKLEADARGDGLPPDMDPADRQRAMEIATEELERAREVAPDVPHVDKNEEGTTRAPGDEAMVRLQEEKAEGEKPGPDADRDTADPSDQEQSIDAQKEGNTSPQPTERDPQPEVGQTGAGDVKQSPPAEKPTEAKRATDQKKSEPARTAKASSKPSETKKK